MAPQRFEGKRDLIRYYDGLASAYDSLYGDEQHLKIESALSAIRLRNSDLVLDVGCGTGLLFDHIEGSVGHIVGLDLSSRLLKVAAERAKRLRTRSPISLIHADADCMPFPDEMFDKIFGFTLLQNLPHPGVTLREIIRVARTDSMIVVTGLKRSFSEERVRSVLAGTGLEVSIERTVKSAQDTIAVCRKA
jgi:ubiquinone/menaquinone biosynthesis C-methylase UbiE